MHRDYVMKPEQFYDNKMFPRVLAIEVGDLYTTNMFAMEDPAEGIEVELGDKFAPNAEGMLEKSDDGFLQAVKLYTLPDMQPAVKLQCIAVQ